MQFYSVLATGADLQAACRAAAGTVRAGRGAVSDRHRAIDGRHALAVLGATDRGIAEQSPWFVGIASDPFADAPDADEFVVRHIVAKDQGSNLMVADAVAAGHTVQLHMRDGEAAARDLRQRPAAARADRSAAAMLFRCLDRDTTDQTPFAEVAEVAGDVPLIGCHCNGQIATLGDATCRHGYTAVLAVLRPRQAPTP